MIAYRHDLFSHAWPTAVRDLLAEGYTVSPRGKKTLEHRDVVFRFPVRSDDDGVVPGRTKPRYLHKELAWYASKDPRAERISSEASLWASVQNPDGTVNSNYGARLWSAGAADSATTTEWGWAVESLVRDPSSRQAVMVVHRPRDHWPANKDVPCTLTLSWHIRDGVLGCTVHMRSSDAWFGLPYDVPFFTWLVKLMRQCLMLRGVTVVCGELTLWLDSLHIYEEKVGLAEVFLGQYVRPPPTLWVPPLVEGGLHANLKAVQDFAAQVYPDREVLA
jgi:thymidylate synthase